MSVLEAHRARVAALSDALERMQSMHDDAYNLWNEVVQLAESDAPERRERLDALHDQSYALADRIARLREETFGSISAEAQLMLTSSVESVPLPREPAAPALAGE